MSIFGPIRKIKTLADQKTIGVGPTSRSRLENLTLDEMLEEVGLVQPINGHFPGHRLLRLYGYTQGARRVLILSERWKAVM